MKGRLSKAVSNFNNFAILTLSLIISRVRTLVDGKSIFSYYNLTASVHFDRFALFQFFFVLIGNILPLHNFRNKKFFKRKLPLFNSLCIILFFSDQLFLLYKSSFEKALKKRAFAIKCVFLGATPK
jgi:hypothetical protein